MRLGLTATELDDGGIKIDSLEEEDDGFQMKELEELRETLLLDPFAPLLDEETTFLFDELDLGVMLEDESTFLLDEDIFSLFEDDVFSVVFPLTQRTEFLVSFFT